MGKRTLVSKVYWSDTAKTQLRHIFDFWAAKNKSISYAVKIRNQAFELCQTISKNPLAFKKASIHQMHVAPMGTLQHRLPNYRPGNLYNYVLGCSPRPQKAVDHFERRT